MKRIPRTVRGAGLALAGAIGLGLPAAGRAAVPLTMSLPIDRQYDQAFYWCHTTDDEMLGHVPPIIPFVANGTEATIEFTFRNFGDSGWIANKIDNVSIVSRATFDAYYQASSMCFDLCDEFAGYFRFDLVPAPELVYFEQFDGIGVGEWQGEQIYQGSDSATRILYGDTTPPAECTPDYSGGCLGIGFDTSPEFNSAHVTVDGLVPGTEYVLSYWWKGGEPDAMEPELTIDVYGPEPWTDVTPQQVLELAISYGASWGDFDGDFDYDVFVTRVFGSPNRLLRNDGGGSFSDVATLAMQSTSELCTASAWGDFDADDDLDLYVSRLGAANQLFVSSGGALNESTPTELAVVGESTGLTWVDWDDDRDLELHVLDNLGPDAFFANEGTGWIPMTTTLTEGESVAWADYDGDGDVDFYFARQGPNVLFRNDDGLYFPVGTGVVEGDAWSYACAWGDYDNDLDLDLLLANADDESRLFRNDGGDTFVDVTPSPLSTTDCYGAAFGDFENDGDLDIFVARYGFGNLLLRNDAGAFANVAGGPFPYTGIDDVTIGVSLADFDDDGDLDAYLANLGRDRLLRNDSPTGNWLHVDLVGVVSNPRGLRARITLTAGSLVQMREVSFDAALWGQNSATAEFGLGGHTTIDQLVVEWPSGIVQTIPGGTIPVDTRIIVTETDPTGAQVVSSSEPARFAADPPHPNPFSRETEIRFETPGPSPVSLKIYDVSGRLVRTLLDEWLPGGPRSVIWDGRGNTGERTATGVYFYRLQTPDRTATRKVVLLRS